MLMYSGGYAGRILRANLTNKTSKEEPLPGQLARYFIGGAGFGIKYPFDEVEPGIDAPGPDNKLIFACGPFTGAGVPCARAGCRSRGSHPSPVLSAWLCLADVFPPK